MERKRNYWQIAAGDKYRNYSDLCINLGVILLGPGYAGPWPKCESKLIEDGISPRMLSIIKRFHDGIQSGDIVVLRLGTDQVHAVGVVDDYGWSDLFSDVDGWDLQHYRRVNWLWYRIESDGFKSFKTHALKRGDTVLKLESTVVLEWIASLGLEIPSSFDSKVLPKLPHEEKTKPITKEVIGEYLYSKGTSSNSITILLNVIDDLVMIAKWYERKAEISYEDEDDEPRAKIKGPSEDETRAYLVIPLLRALGWSPQKMAIEWNNIDVALFDRLPREDNNLAVVVETKPKGAYCLNAFSQASEYAENMDHCNRLIVTDGLRYGVFVKQDHTYNLRAYMNLTSFKKAYPIYDCAGICEALWMMTPEWTPSSV